MTTRHREMGIAGAVIILAQFVSNIHGTHSVSEEINAFKKEFQQSRLDQEQYFARKTDLNPIIIKLDAMSDQMSKIHDKVTSLKSFLKEKYGYDEAEAPLCRIDDYVGC